MCRLGAIAFIQAAVGAGFWEVLQQYLQLRLDFTTLDQVQTCPGCIQASQPPFAFTCSTVAHLELVIRCHSSTCGCAWTSPRWIRCRPHLTVAGPLRLLVAGACSTVLGSGTPASAP